MMMGPGLAVPRYRGQGWVEFMVTLASDACPDGAAGVPHIEVEVTGGKTGRVSNRGEALNLVDELRTMATTLEAWAPRLPE